jgi:hypothetical protein
VLPQTQTEGEKYLKDAGLTGVRVVSAKLSTIGVNGTPTILLVDGAGKVKSACIQDCSMEMQTTVTNCTGSYCGYGYPC